MRRPAIVLVVLASAVLWVAIVIAAPRAAASSTRAGVAVAAAAYAGGALICHQRAERSFHVAGAKLPVCARCLGLYVGGLIGVLAWAAVAGLRPVAAARAAWGRDTSRLRPVLIIAAMPTAASVAMAWLGWWDGSNSTRALLALPLGAAAGALVTAVLAKDLR